MIEKGMTNGFHSLDKATDGWWNSDFSLIVGDTKNEESSFATSYARRLSSYNIFLFENKSSKDNRDRNRPIFIFCIQIYVSQK